MTRKLVINSHIDYQKPLELFLNSIQDQPIKQEDILIIKAGGTQYSRLANTIIADNNSFDLTAFITIIDLDLDFEEFFYIHDTCIAGQAFIENVKNLPKTDNSIPLWQNACMNMGLYNVKYVKSKKEILLPLKNTNYDKVSIQQAKIQAIRHEGILNNPQKGKFKIETTFKQTGPTDYYGTGIPRVVEHYPTIDIYKIKANYKPEETWITTY
jgi:hypothetical protein